jgi:hypothetical protein
MTLLFWDSNGKCHQFGLWDADGLIGLGFS